MECADYRMISKKQTMYDYELQLILQCSKCRVAQNASVLPQYGIVSKFVGVICSFIY